jgi:hypothetical protein
LQNEETVGSVTLTCLGAVASAAVTNYPIVATNATGGTFNATNYDITYIDGTLKVLPAGDLNGDNIVDQAELNAVLASYWNNTNNPVYMTKPANLCGNWFQFELTNAGEFTIQFSTNLSLSNWTTLPGPAYPVYQFIDEGATNSPRFYRVVRP